MQCIMLASTHSILMTRSAPFSPSKSQNVKTNVGKCLPYLIDEHFPSSSPLHKIFNRKTLKLSYSCMTNNKTVISNHNKAQINKPDPTNDKNCNCRNSSMCPMNGKCNQNMIYRAEVTTSTSRETYINLWDTTFKLRYRNHVCSFPGGILKKVLKVLYGEAPPRGPIPYPFIYHFFRKGTPFIYLLKEDLRISC